MARKAYYTDLTDAEYRILEPLLPVPAAPFFRVMPAFWPMIICFGLSGASISLLQPLLGISLLSIIPANMRPHAQALVGIFQGI